MPPAWPAVMMGQAEFERTKLDRGRDAAVHRDHRAGHVGTRPRGEVDGDPGHVVRTADPLERRRLRYLLAERLQRRGHHLGLERPRGDRVDGDMPWTQLAG